MPERAGRENDVPDFHAALDKAGVRAAFNELTPTDQQAVGNLINSVKDRHRRERYIQVFVNILRASSRAE